MATIDRAAAIEPDRAPTPYVAPLSRDELRRRNRRAAAMLDRWEREGDEQEQRETMDVLRKALGEGRELSDRPLFP